MGIVWTLVIGLVAGIVAKFLMPGKDPGGFIITILLGIAGAFVATYLGQAIGWYEAGQQAGFIGAVVGAVMLGGGVPYKDAWDFNPPGLFFVYTGALALPGDGMRAVRILEALAWASLVGAFAGLGRRFAGGFAPGSREPPQPGCDIMGTLSTAQD